VVKCAPFDLRDYALDELNPEGRRQVESHLAGCGACRSEVERLCLTRQALLRVPDEEIPRRIAFVSDKVFEPAWYERGWAALPRLAFALAVLLAVFFAGAWSERRHQARLAQAVQALEARHDAQMRGIEDAFYVLNQQINQLYRQEAEPRPASFRQ
jgi:anti-sigma factor RsiW